MNRFGMVLNQLGLQPAITELQQTYILPLQHVLFGLEGHNADDHHCFVVRYKKGEDVGLVVVQRPGCLGCSRAEHPGPQIQEN